MFFDLKRENKQCAFGMGDNGKEQNVMPPALGDNHNEHNGNTTGTAEDAFGIGG